MCAYLVKLDVIARNIERVLCVFSKKCNNAKEYRKSMRAYLVKLDAITRSDIVKHVRI